MKKKKVLLEIYDLLYERFGPQHWWPGDTALEVIVGAILTQNTNWGNVEKAIGNLRSRGLLTARGLRNLDQRRLARLIRPAGYFNVKARRLKSFVGFLFRRYQGSLKKLFREKTGRLREELLSIKGIGPETADSILLYAALRPVFVVDAYTRRVLGRHHLTSNRAGYGEIQSYFEERLKPDARLFNEYHALLVKLGKTYCRRIPLCNECPLRELAHSL